MKENVQFNGQNVNLQYNQNSNNTNSSSNQGEIRANERVDEQKKERRAELYLGQRVPKSEDNKFGWKDKIRPDQIDRTKPIVICLPGSGVTSPKKANGMCKNIENLLGVSEFAPEDKPCQIYCIYLDNNDMGYHWEKEARYFANKEKGELPDMSQIPPQNKADIEAIERFASELVEGLFKPLVQDENGQLYDEMEIARGFRNVHFVSFCYGSIIQSAINQKLRSYLESTGLDEGTIEDLESQICVLQSAPVANETKTGQTTINFISLADYEMKKSPINEKTANDFLEMEDHEKIAGGVLSGQNANPVVYVKEFTCIGDEEHLSEFYFHQLDKWITTDFAADLKYGRLKENELVGGVLPLCTAICLRRAMENAVFNARSKKYIPLRSKDVLGPCEKFMDFANEAPQESVLALLEIYNANIDYKKVNLIESIRGK